MYRRIKKAAVIGSDVMGAAGIFEKV